MIVKRSGTGGRESGYATASAPEVTGWPRDELADLRAPTRVGTLASSAIQIADEFLGLHQAASPTLVVRGRRPRGEHLVDAASPLLHRPHLVANRNHHVAKRADVLVCGY